MPQKLGDGEDVWEVYRSCRRTTRDKKMVRVWKEIVIHGKFMANLWRISWRTSYIKCFMLGEDTASNGLFMAKLSKLVKPFVHIVSQFLKKFIGITFID